MTQPEPVNFRYLRDLLGVSSNQLWMWHNRRATTGFPEAVAQVHIPQHMGDKRKAPLFDLEAVLEWHADYDPNAHRGSHWATKRANGVEHPIKHTRRGPRVH